MPVQVKPLTIRPATGQGVDTRSMPDEVDFGSWRHSLNWGVTSKGRLCRIPGWDRFLTGTDYNNQDLHDQLIAHSPPLLDPDRFTQRMPITFLFEAISTRKSTKLMA